MSLPPAPFLRRTADSSSSLDNVIPFRLAKARSAGWRCQGIPMLGQLLTVETGIPSSRATKEWLPKRPRILRAKDIPSCISKDWTNVNPLLGPQRSEGRVLGLEHSGRMPKPKPKPAGRKGHSSEDDLMKRQVGANLKRVRKYFRDNQDQFAERLNIPKSTLNKYEIGESFPRPSVFRDLIAKLRVNAQYLFTGIEPMFISNIHAIQDKRSSLDEHFG